MINSFVLNMFSKEHFHVSCDVRILAKPIDIKYKITKCFRVWYLDIEKYFA